MHLTAELLETAKAQRGWLICRKIDPTGEVKTKGGIVIPVDDKKNYKMCIGEVVSCGEYYDAKSGDGEKHKGWPLKRGTVVMFHPHSPWEPPMGDGNTENNFVCIKSIDVMATLEAE